MGSVAKRVPGMRRSEEDAFGVSHVRSGFAPITGADSQTGVSVLVRLPSLSPRPTAAQLSPECMCANSMHRRRPIPLLACYVCTRS